MTHKKFQEWLSGIDDLSLAQRQQAEAGLSGGSEASASLAATEDSVGEDRRGPHCDCQSQSKMGPCRGVKMGHFG